MQEQQELVTDQDIKAVFETQERPFFFGFNEFVENQKHYESNARTYPNRLPISIARAEGIYVQDTEGRVYLDCLCCAGALPIGHNHPAVLQAVRDAIDCRVPMTTLDITTPVKDAFVRDLLRAMPAAVSAEAKIQFCSPSGADGIEAAIKLVKTATGRRGIMAFQGSYHGMTHGALALTGMVKPKADIPNLMQDVVFLPYPYDYRCPFGIGGREGEQAILNYIANTLSDPFSGIPPIAGMVVEVIQGEGGVIPCTDHWLRELRRITREHDIPLIIDEVQTGIGRTGQMFAFERSGIVPDVVVISKGIGGSLPLSLLVYNKRLDKWSSGAHVGTFRGNQLAMAAGSAMLNVVGKEGLLDNAREIGNYFLSRLHSMMKKFPIIGDVRGRGLMIAAEIVDITAAPDARGKYPVDSSTALLIQRHCLQLGLIVELGGRGDSTIRFLPPLNIDMDIASTILDIFEASLTTMTPRNNIYVNGTIA